MHNKLRSLWNDGATAVNAWLGIPSTVTAEIVSRQGFDAITVDLQHGITDYSSAVPMLQAISASDATPMARVPWLEPGIIMKLLDAGALGIVCPMINTPADAERFVRYCRYAPEGERSFGPVRAGLVHGPAYARQANESIVTLAMIETGQGLANVAEIVRTPGLTGVYIGPSDLGLSLGYEAKLDQTEPVVVDAIKRILEAARDAGIRAGIHCLAPAYAREMLGLGFDLVTLGTDIRLFTAAYADAMRALRA
ncbi:MAG: 2,4-dihydroxyhept-2-ene-1,7-dioic acid aldolase [Gammaproteobacteria bacterium]|nr:2,4-dihydroxyhept-2-ene-1,7-dioic acid aldolase [Gammaproteobacteria bacterium]NIM72259.1 2,4-dihydroxyhept-2-ene-1,7-dioic acid aldolase [Gammaproteobacteria bacterium]NIN39174.1 2,4-dihydroxyhept-2-ene-1,7-dioic acid aldolase [Gammaproteobacteria bacterium]NIO24007.1 2,4-dihydroxyhept-2-ene-1,7-dioic acid aldolase [Gammaproteobacteria bacterium]NIO64659.1 2,4-dihydroxyhept-2-ene-1,7-dioic acid aldolase [Gammaproteobacteria bacterium]